MDAERRRRLLLAALVVVTVTKGVTWIALFPVWKIADEPAHFDNVQYRAEHGLRHPPPQTAPMDKVITKGASPEVRTSWATASHYFRNNHLPRTRVVPEEAQLANVGATPDSRRSNGQMPALDYPGFYYNVATLAYNAFRTSSVLVRVTAVRFVSLGFGLLAVLATFFAARRAFDSDPLAFAAAMLVGLQPMFSQQSAAVNNDAGVFGLCALGFYLQVRLITVERPPVWTGWLLGVCMALAICTKPQGLSLIPTSVIALAMTARRWTVREAGWVALKVAGGLVAVLVLATAWEALRPALEHGPPRPPLPRAYGPYPSPFKFMFWLSEIDADYADYLFRSGWGQFCWLDVSLPGPWLDDLHRLASLVTLGGVAAIVHRVLVAPARALWWRLAPTAFAAVSALTGVLFILFVEYYARIRLLDNRVIQGRNFLFVLPPFAVVVCVALGSLVGQRFRTASAALIVLGALALNVASLVIVLGFHYSD